MSTDSFRAAALRSQADSSERVRGTQVGRTESPVADRFRTRPRTVALRFAPMPEVPTEPGKPDTGTLDPGLDDLKRLRDVIAESATTVSKSFIALESVALYLFVTAASLVPRDVLSDRASSGHLSLPVIGVETHLTLFFVVLFAGVLVLVIDLGGNLRLLADRVRDFVALAYDSARAPRQLPAWGPVHLLVTIASGRASRSSQLWLVVVLAIAFAPPVASVVYAWFVYANGGALPWRVLLATLVGLVFAATVGATSDVWGGLLASGPRRQWRVALAGGALVLVSVLIGLMPVQLDLRSQDLSGLDLTVHHAGEWFADPVDFRDARLDGADFTGARLSQLDFTGAVMRNADFSLAHLRGADLTCTKLAGARFVGANLADTMFVPDASDATVSARPECARPDVGADRAHGADLRYAQMTDETRALLVHTSARLPATPEATNARTLARACVLALHPIHATPPSWLAGEVRLRSAEVSATDCAPFVGVPPSESAP